MNSFSLGIVNLYSDENIVLLSSGKVYFTTVSFLFVESNIPIVVFSIYERGNLGKILNGEGHFTTIS